MVAVLGELGLDLHGLVGIAGEEPAVGHFDGDDADRICEKEDGCSFPIWSEFWEIFRKMTQFRKAFPAERNFILRKQFPGWRIR